MGIQQKEVRLYVEKGGKAPFETWFSKIKNLRTQNIILGRIRRCEFGNPGHWRSVGLGVKELKIGYGPGYRVYYGEDGNTLIILLCGGDKKSQRKDIVKAQEFWKKYRSQK